ncbi:hypothetical protein L195_g025575 [Trifolium pratense]|uniref:Uncharacterized protein n=1 Tax=Trifolium pratense TaxID=57577 RepID=A0A2K3NGW4_TRIPR|nr:hypothetical protein L195_g025575 [Trifolium pratense]
METLNMVVVSGDIKGKMRWEALQQRGMYEVSHKKRNGAYVNDEAWKKNLEVLDLSENPYLVSEIPEDIGELDMEQTMCQSTLIRKFESEARLGQVAEALYCKISPGDHCPHYEVPEVKCWFQTKLQDSPQVPKNELVSPQGCKGEISCTILKLLG